VFKIPFLSESRADSPLHAHHSNDWARGLESALKMVEPIVKINLKNVAKRCGNEVIRLYYDFREPNLGIFFNSCPVKIPM